MVTTAEKLYTPQEFGALPDEMTDGCELIDGRLIKKHIWSSKTMGMTLEMLRHALTVRLAWRALDDAAVRLQVGLALTEPLVDVGAARQRSRRPDIALFAGALPTEPEAVQTLVPVMAVEVISPSNTAVDVLEKTEEYLAAGTRLVWQMFPTQRIITVAWPDRTATFRAGDIVTAEPALPGFACPVTDLFPPPAKSAG